MFGRATLRALDKWMERWGKEALWRRKLLAEHTGHPLEITALISETCDRPSGSRPPAVFLFPRSTSATCWRHTPSLLLFIFVRLPHWRFLMLSCIPSNDTLVLTIPRVRLESLTSRARFPAIFAIERHAPDFGGTRLATTRANVRHPNGERDAVVVGRDAQPNRGHSLQDSAYPTARASLPDTDWHRALQAVRRLDIL
jgi:hypothetical protein